VEFALIASLLSMLLFGIIEFGVILAVKSSVTQAASEGARAAVPQLWCPPNSTCTYPNTSGTPAACRGKAVTTQSLPDFTCLYGAASDQASKTMSWLSPCSSSSTAAVQCTSSADYCTPGDSTTGVCISTKVVYDYQDNPIFPSLPLLSTFLPSTIPSQTVVKVNPCSRPAASGGAPNCG
jgi:Flp pilus assembly protein TadG